MRMSVLSFGAGAIGTYIGGSLALNGNKVVFLERPDVAAELRQRGLRLSLPDGEHVLPDAVLAGSLEEALASGPFDVALFALKSFDTQTAIEDWKKQGHGIIHLLPPVLCLQNGVENESALAGALGDGRVIAATITSAVGRRAAGDIILERLRGMGISAGHPISGRLAVLCQQAGLNPRLYGNAASMKWSKMLTNLLANATSAILDMTPAQIFADPGLFRLEVEQQREAMRVMRAMHLPVVDLPGTPVRLLAFGIRWLPVSIVRPFMKKAVGSGRGAKMPSFHIDLHGGRKSSEVNYLNGAVVRFGRQAGIATPVNHFLNETLLALANGKLPLDTYAQKPEKLLREFHEQS